MDNNRRKNKTLSSINASIKQFEGRIMEDSM